MKTNRIHFAGFSAIFPPGAIQTFSTETKNRLEFEEEDKEVHIQ